MISFDDYLKKYRGNNISTADDFNVVIAEATARVDNLCVNKSALSGDFAQERYTLAVCATADALCSQQRSKNISSESVGDHSVTYSTRSSAEIEKEINRKAMTFLRGTGLLYGGMAECSLTL